MNPIKRLYFATGVKLRAFGKDFGKIGDRSRFDDDVRTAVERAVQLCAESGAISAPLGFAAASVIADKTVEELAKKIGGREIINRNGVYARVEAE